MFFTTTVQNQTVQQYWMPPEIWAGVYCYLDIKAAYCFSRVNTYLNEMYRSEVGQKKLIPSHFTCSLDPSRSYQEQYLDLFSSRISSKRPNGFPLYRKCLSAKECSLERFDKKLKFNLSETALIIKDSEGLWIWQLNTRKSPKFVQIDEMPDYFGFNSKGDAVCGGTLEEGDLKFYDSKTRNFIRSFNLIDANYPILVSVNIKGSKAISIHTQTKEHVWDRDWSYTQPLYEISKLWM